MAVGHLQVVKKEDTAVEVVLALAHQSQILVVQVVEEEELL